MADSKNARDARDMVAIEGATLSIGLTPEEAERLARELVKMEREYRAEEPLGMKGDEPWDEDRAYQERLAHLQTSVPAFEVEVGPYRIDRHPVTNAQWAEYLAETGAVPPVNWDLWRDDPRWDEMFVTGVSWREAKAYAEHYGLDLPTEAEWERAARDGRSFFPWGDEYFPQGRAAFEPPNNVPYPVGSRPELESWAGVHELVGMFGEYCLDLFEPYPGGDLTLFDRLYHGQWGGKYAVRGGYDIYQDSTCVCRLGRKADFRSKLGKVRCVDRNPG